MAHIASQILPGEIPYSQKKGKATAPMLQRSPEFHDFQRPERPRRRKTNNSDDLPNLSLLISTPDNKTWKYRPIRYPSCASEIFSPASVVDSIFELSSAEPVESPNTPYSAARDNHVAELEDTSPIAVSKRVVPKDPVVLQLESFMEKLHRPEISSRAAAAIESISAIEADNRYLLERAIAAEEAAKLLKDKNKSLQHRIDYCIHAHRPKTVPEKKPRAVSTSADTSSFTMTSLQKSQLAPPLLQTPQTPTRTRRSVPAPLMLSSLSPDKHAEDPFRIDYGSPITPISKRRPSPHALSQPLFSPPLPKDVPPSPFATISFPINRRRPPALYLHTSKSSPRLTLESSTMTNTTNRATQTIDSLHIPRDTFAKLTADEINVTKREIWKALPPNGPMSPSAIPGKVEIGIEKRCEGSDEGERKRKFAGMWRWGRKGHSYSF